MNADGNLPISASEAAIVAAVVVVAAARTYGTVRLGN